MDLDTVLTKFRKSVGWNPQVVEIETTKCQVCGHQFAGVNCGNCGWTESKEDEPKELSPLQRLVKSLRTRNVRNVVKSVDWSADLQTCFYCGSQFGRQLDVCPHCNRKVPDDKERFLRSLGK